MLKTYNIVTFGCQMNEHDSENIAGMLENMGYIKNEERNSADVAIINTCSIRENADKRFFGTLGQLKKVKENIVLQTVLKALFQNLMFCI